MERNKKRFVRLIILNIVVASFLLLPILIPLGIAGGTLSSIFSFFNQSGKVGIQQEQLKIMKEVIGEFKTSEFYGKIFKEKVKPVADKVEIKYSKILIPLLFAQDLESKNVDSLIEEAATLAVNKKEDSLGFVIELKKSTVYKDKLKEYTDSHIVTVLNSLGYLFDDDLPLTTEELAKLGGGTLIYPLRKKAIVTSEYGPRNIEVNGRWFNASHRGIDLAYSGKENTCGVSIYAAHDGVVYDVEKEDAARKGYYVFLKNEEKNLRTAYLHLHQPPRWNVGDTIKKGELIGLIGTTGLSTGCHLHFQIGNLNEWINPRKYLDFDNPKLP